MNNIQEDDWACESWGGHTGMSNDSDYSGVDHSSEEEKLSNDTDRGCS